jgi:hypothetical protein
VVPHVDNDSEKERLQSLHIALEAALEQLSYAQQIAARGTEIDAPSEDVKAVERIFGDLTQVRNRVRDRLMKVLSKPGLNIIK